MKSDATLRSGASLRSTSEKCAGCKYFVKIKYDKKAGECHRYAPRPNPRPKMQIEGKDLWADIQWPKVAVNAWCGEFGRK